MDFKFNKTGLSKKISATYKTTPKNGRPRMELK